MKSFMLVSLHVKNLALIDETEVFFGEGLNILSGETGAGKSIIIGSVNLALGAKADKDLIRTNAEYALVELVFQVDGETQLAQLKELDIPVEEDNMLIIQEKNYADAVSLQSERRNSQCQTVTAVSAGCY